MCGSDQQGCAGATAPGHHFSWVYSGHIVYTSFQICGSQPSTENLSGYFLIISNQIVTYNVTCYIAIHASKFQAQRP